MERTRRKLIRKSFRSYAEARSWRVDAMRAAQHGTLRPPSKVTLAEAADRWLEQAKAGRIRNRSGQPFKPSTLRGYERDLEQRVKPALGHLPLTEVRRRDIQELVDDLPAPRPEAQHRPQRD